MPRISLRANRFSRRLLLLLASRTVVRIKMVRLAIHRWPRPMLGGDSPRDLLIDDFLRRHFKLDLQ
jgi:hypothetical protein